ncbi:MAG: hypothetical protein ACR2HS_05900 [Gammaproteobacteria bacterium]
MSGTSDIPLLDHRLTSMENQLGGLKSSLNDIDKKTTQLIDALIGNPLTQSKGLSAEITEVKKKVYEHERILKKAKWFSLGFGAAGSAVILIIQLLFKLFSK